MDNNYLEKIEQAENKADEIINNALKEAEKLNEQANRTLKANQGHFEETLEKKSNDIINEQINNADIKVKAILEQNHLDCEKIKNDSQENVEKALSFVIEKIGVSKCQ